MCEGCELRRTAMRRRLAGEKVKDICMDLGKSRGWFYYWASRYDPDDITSLCDLPRGPHQPAGKTPTEIEQAIVNSRRARVAKETPGMRYALIGAEAIQLELMALGVKGVPTARTVHRILPSVQTDRKAQPSGSTTPNTPGP